MPGLVAHWSSRQVSSKILTPPTMVGASTWHPLPLVGAGKALTPASWWASISSASSRAVLGGTAGLGGVEALAAAGAGGPHAASDDTAAGSATAAMVPSLRKERRLAWASGADGSDTRSVSYTHLRAHETP